jgi:hypothetical protein
VPAIDLFDSAGVVSTARSALRNPFGVSDPIGQPCAQQTRHWRVGAGGARVRNPRAIEHPDGVILGRGTAGPDTVGTRSVTGELV